MKFCIYNINRSASETFIKRNTNRLLGKSTWYRRKKNKKEDKKGGKKVYKKKREEKKDEKLRVKSVIMVPKTKDSPFGKVNAGEGDETVQHY